MQDGRWTISEGCRKLATSTAPPSSRSARTPSAKESLPFKTSTRTPRGLVWVNGANVGEFTVFNSGGNPTYSVKGDQGFVSWGGDIAEHFDASAKTGEPGAVMPSTRAYDRLVAGVVSGANAYSPGVALGVNREAQSRVPVTLTGRVYVRASNDNGAIRRRRPAGDVVDPRHRDAIHRLSGGSRGGPGKGDGEARGRHRSHQDPRNPPIDATAPGGSPPLTGTSLPL
jgi:hypothetical protein